MGTTPTTTARRQPVAAETPNICKAINKALEDASYVDPTVSDRAVSRALDISHTTIRRWRRESEPSFDQLAALEAFLKLPRGQIARNAGYVADDSERDDVIVIKVKDLSPSYREMLLAARDVAIEGTKREMKQRASWAEQKRR